MTKTCGQCVYCQPNYVCNGDHICTKHDIEVSKYDDTIFYDCNLYTPLNETPETLKVKQPAKITDNIPI